MKYLNQQAIFPVTVKRFAIVVFLSLGLVACDDDDTSTTSATISPVVLNDTGLASLTGCADQLNEGLACVDTATTHPRQDADLGRDADGVLNDNSDGSLGFSFTKIDASGAQLAAAAPSWDCVLDNVTGLIWEVKTAVAADLRANTNTYTWYDPNRAYASGDRGVENGGACSVLASCDTAAYVAATNGAGLCGLTDWRLPSRAELQSIVDYSQDEPGPMLDSNYFPNVHNPNSVHGLHRDWYWSSQTAAGYAKYAWTISFNTGGDTQMPKQTPQLIRLVRGGS